MSVPYVLRLSAVPLAQPALLASVIIGLSLIGGSLILAQGRGSDQVVRNVTMEGETQVVEVTAKGGYTPRTTTAKAGVPTILRLKTNGTYDCSAAVSIPALNYRKTMDPTGVTDVEIPAQDPGKVIQGLCAMGMYNFSVSFI